MVESLGFGVIWFQGLKGLGFGAWGLRGHCGGFGSGLSTLCGLQGFL